MRQGWRWPIEKQIYFRVNVDYTVKCRQRGWEAKWRALRFILKSWALTYWKASHP